MISFHMYPVIPCYWRALLSLTAVLVVLAFPSYAQVAPVPVSTVSYTLSQEVTPDPVWKVSIVGTGYSKPPRLRLNPWGEWPQWEGYYVRNLAAFPAVRDTSLAKGVLEFVERAEWKGSFEVKYEIPLLRHGSSVEQRAPLLPSFSDQTSCGFAINTLMEVLPAENEPERGKTKYVVRIIPPPGASVATGWGGVTKGVQEIVLTEPLGNTPILLGFPASLRRNKQEGILYEVAQFGSGTDRTNEVLTVAQNVVSLYQRDSGHKRSRPVRLFLYDGAAFNTHTTSASLLGYRTTEDGFSLSSKHVVAHELFHDWLGAGGWIEGNESIAWFHEGFTDYLSLWYIAASGLVDREWFARRLTGIDASARRSSAFGKISFAQKDVRWRSDGYETLAYRGGAILAFLTDIELRKQDGPGLMKMIAQLGAHQRTGPITIQEIAEWMKRQGLEAFYKLRYEGMGLPEIGNPLKSIGYVVEEVEAELTYFGIRIEGDQVVELDPQGPAALAGVRIGDRIHGYFPSREERPTGVDQVQTRFRYGLDRVEPGRAGTYLDIKRPGQPSFELPIQPQIIRGGLIKRYNLNKEKLDEFFVFRGSK